jgi:serine/threonine protein kinase
LDKFGKYKIIGEIGQGATSHVYKGYDETLSRHVAIKAIAAEASGDETLRKRFEREAQSAAGLSHPNIVTVYDYGQEQDKLYMAMELLEGVDLKQAFADRRLKTLDDKFDVMEQVCEGLAFAHANGIVHRDLKPANLHLMTTGQVKIMDFGLARLVGSDMTRLGTVMGTPHYMSPEQVRGEHVDARSDVFSLGCVFYELLTGKKPFDGDSLHSVLYKVMQAEPAPLGTVATTVPAALAQVIERAMARAAADRFPDASEFRRYLGEAREAIAAGRGGEPLPGLAALAPATATPRPPVPPAPAAPPARESPGSSVRPMASSASSVTRRVERSSGARSRHIPPPPPKPQWPLVLGILAGVAVLGLVVYLVISRNPPSDGGRAVSPQLDALTRSLVETQVELARKKLTAGDYEDALHQAERALKLDPSSTAAQDLLKSAQKVKDQIDHSSADTRAALESKDGSKAAAAYWQLLQVAPESPVAAELASAVDPDFKTQADEARRLMSEARQAAEKAQAKGTDAFREGGELAKAAEVSLQKKAYAASGRDFMRARDRFQKALR